MIAACSSSRAPSTPSPCPSASSSKASRPARTPTSPATRATSPGSCCTRSPVQLVDPRACSRRGTDHLCVESPADLDGDGPRVTSNGQTRNGRRGAHGDLSDASIIGFSSADRLAEITTEISELDASWASSCAANVSSTPQAETAAPARERAQVGRRPPSGAASTSQRQRRTSATGKRTIDRHPGGQRCPRPPWTRSTPAVANQTVRSAKPSQSARRTGTTLLGRLDAQLCEQQDLRRRSRSTASTPTAPSRSSTTRPTISTRVHGGRQPWTASPTSTAACSKLRSRLSGSSADPEPRGRRASSARLRCAESSRPIQSRRGPTRTAAPASTPTPSTATILDKIPRPASPNAARNGAVACRSGAGRISSRWQARSMPRSRRSRPASSPSTTSSPTLPFGPSETGCASPCGVLHSRRHHRVPPRTEAARLRHHRPTAATSRPSTVLRLRSFIAPIRKPDGGYPGSVSRDLYLDVRRHVEITAVRVDAARPRARHLRSLGGKSRRRNPRTRGVHRRRRAALPARRRNRRPAPGSRRCSSTKASSSPTPSSPAGCTCLERPWIPADRRRPASTR